MDAARTMEDHDLNETRTRIARLLASLVQGREWTDLTSWTRRMERLGPAKSFLEPSPVGESQSSGGIVAGQTRAPEDALARNKITADEQALSRQVELAAALVNRCEVAHDRKTTARTTLWQTVPAVRARIPELLRFRRHPAAGKGE